MPAQTPAPLADLIEPGQPAPAFTLKDQDGKTHKLSDYRGRWVVLYFYPRDNTPGCTIQACGFRDNHSKLQKLNAVVLGVSPDDEKAHQKFVEKRKLSFPLLVDPDQAIATKYGAWREKKLFAKKYMGIVRTTYLIDPQGKVARRWDKVKVAGHVADVIKTISKAG
jgi:peroxiredoxin Q/BCP